MATTQNQTGLTALFSDLFVLGTVLKGSSQCGDPVSLRSRLIEMFLEVDRRGEALGFPKDVLRQAQYAVAALLDEMVMSSRWPEKHRWASHLLQYELFQTQVAGVEFFAHLDAVRRKLPLNTDLLQVYYLCLTLGFQGQYSMAGRERLTALIEDIRRDLQVKQGEVQSLAPHGKRQEDVRPVRKDPIFTWVVGGVVIGIVLLLYIGLAFMASMDAATVATKVEDLSGQVTEGGR